MRRVSCIHLYPLKIPKESYQYNQNLFIHNLMKAFFNLDFPSSDMQQLLTLYIDLCEQTQRPTFKGYGFLN